MEDFALEKCKNIVGSRFNQLEKYAQSLIADGVAHGHIGPKEAKRIWSRHILNSLQAGELLLEGSVIDIGSGAGLPGIPLAITYPEIHFHLVESMKKRVLFLESVTKHLPNITIHHGKIENHDIHKAIGTVNNVTARAVKPLPQLLEWSRPYLHNAGKVLFLKGATALNEIEKSEEIRIELGYTKLSVETLGEGPESLQTIVVVGEIRE